VSELAGNPRKHAENLQKIVETASNQSASSSQGEPSLQNSLEVALQSLRHIPPHASREVGVNFGRLALSLLTFTGSV
jgi:transcription initiation factor TFIIH subunit 2